MVEEWLNKFVVVKQADLNAYLNRDEYYLLITLLDKVQAGRLSKEGKYPQNYYIVNKDEPYADAVRRLIESGWS